jgi:serine/threonine-protein kinase
MTQPRLVGGRYELGELIGYGGMAEVHRGRDARLGRDVAIKMLRADLARDPSFLARFRREAQAAAGLNHPSIVSVYDTGEDDTPEGTPQPYIVMEFVEGRTLRDVLKAEGALPARRVMEIGADICGALDFSHRNGIVHRDIKPANVMITPSGAVKVMDFGIARAVADNAATVTQTANVIGTAQYLSPEQARGESVDPRSDVYSTGCLLYELATGVPPFQGDSPVAVAYQHVRENAPAPSVRNPQIPRALDSIIMKALAKNQLNRYQSAADMRSDLQRALANQPVTAEAVMTDAERTQFISRTPPPVAVPRRDYDEPVAEEDRRRTGLIWLAVVIAMLLVVGGILALIFLNRSESPTVATAQVPPVIGMTEDAAKQAFSQAGFTDVQPGAPVTDISKCAKPVNEGQVCTVSPDPGTSIKVNQPITYAIFTIEKVSVPSVVGDSYDDAARKLVSLGLRPVGKPVDQAGNCSEAKCVISQDPQPYGSPVPKGTSVTLTYWSGKVKLADVKGKTYDDARGTLNQQGFLNVAQDSTTIPTTNQAQDGLVADENPTAGLAYPVATKITLTLYKYVPPSPTCNPTPTSGPTGAPTGGTSGSPTGSPAPTGGASTGLPPC